MRVRRGAAIGAAVLAAALGGCGAEPADDTLLPAGTTATAGTTAVATVPIGGRTRLDGFGEITVTVVDEDGRTRTFCLLLADTPELQQRGLMYITDPALGGYDGMVFSYEQDAGGGFWMRSTRLPLSIAWIAADGTTVSTADMEPCPDSVSTCPVYPAGGSYRFAVEVAQGRLDELGISDRSRVSLGAEECPPV
jgi:uncharacterized protein